MPDIKNEKIIITLSYGSGIQYRTSTVSANDIIIDDRKLKPEEKENLVLDKCRAFLPPGAVKHSTKLGSLRNGRICW